MDDLFLYEIAKQQHMVDLVCQIGEITDSASDHAQAQFLPLLNLVVCALRE